MSGVFISHATKDDHEIDRIAAVLNAAGIETWTDHRHGIEAGDIWSRAIQDAVNACDVGLFVLSPASAQSDYCEAEWNHILKLGKRLYIAQIESVAPMEFPLRLGIIQYTDLSADFEKGMTALIRAMRGEPPLDAVASTVKRGKRVTSSYDDRYSTYSIPMEGRDADLAKALAELKAAPLFITGVGGLGKSRLAAEIVRVGDHAGAVWLRCDDTTSAEALYRLLRRHYMLDATTEPHDVIAHVPHESSLLVVIDNAESIPNTAQADFEQAVDRLTRVGAAVIVTTRVMNWTIPRRKRAFEPSPLGLEDGVCVVQAMVDDLGIKRDTAVFADQLATAAHLHPRLIEMAVGKLDYEPLDEILRELDSLSADPAAALNEMIGSTAARMETHDPGATETLRRLAICRGGFTLDAARAISGLDGDALTARLKTLVQGYRFVRFKDERFGIDDLVRIAVGEDESAPRLHYDYYKGLAQQQDSQQDFAKLDIEGNNLQSAFEWAIQNDVEAAYWLFYECTIFFHNRGNFVRRLEWIERVQGGTFL